MNHLIQLWNAWVDAGLSWRIGFTVPLLLGIVLSLWLKQNELVTEWRYKAYQLLPHGLRLKRPIHTTILLIEDEAYWNGALAGRVPINRAYLAELIRELSDIKPDHPKVIALDFDFRVQNPEEVKRSEASHASVEYESTMYRDETRQLLQAIRYATSKNIAVVVPASIWRENGEYEDERDVYEDRQLATPENWSPPRTACSDCGPLDKPERVAIGGNNPALIYFGYIALPHETWRMPLTLRLSNGLRRESFSLAIANANQAVQHKPPTKLPPTHSEAPFAGYFGLHNWLAKNPSTSEGDFHFEQCDVHGKDCNVVLARSLPNSALAMRFDRTRPDSDFPHQNDGKEPLAASIVDPKTFPALSDKIVLIGGGWHANGAHRGPVVDTYMTPAGKMPGVFIHADYVEAFVQGATYSPTVEWVFIVLDILLCFYLALLFKRAEHHRPSWPLYKTRWIILTLLVAILGSYSLFVAKNIFFDYTVLVLVFVLHAFYDQVHEWKAAAEKCRATHLVVLMLLMTVLLSPRAAADNSPQQSSSSSGSQASGGTKSDQKKQDQDYKNNDIDVNKVGGARGPKIPWVIVQMANAKGDNIGRATITSLKAGGVDVKLDLSDLPPGEHALHFHQVPKCDPPDFKSAGPHFNPEKR